jgi:hypothetical protein
MQARFEAAFGPGTLDAADHDGGLPNALFELLTIDLRGGGQISKASADLALAALTESGYIAPEGSTDADILRHLELTGSTFSRSAAEADQHQRDLLLACAVALRAGDPYAAQTFLDGPEGAGIGWDLCRQAVQERLGGKPSV